MRQLIMWLVAFVVGSLILTYIINYSYFSAREQGVEGLADDAIEGVSTFFHNVNPLYVDCGNDKQCFEEHLLFCEKAESVPDLNSTVIKGGPLYGPAHTYNSTTKTVVRIESFEERTIELLGSSLRQNFCRVSCSNVREVDSGLVKNIYCYFLTNSPSSQEKKVERPELFECVEARD